MGVPATAEAMAVVRSTAQLQQAVDHAQQQGWPITLLGEGSNTLFVKDVEGMVIHNQIKGIEVTRRDQHFVYLNVNAGENWHEWVCYCLEHAYYGLENLALIPGLVGAAPIQNIGAYGVEVKDTIESLTVYDIAQKQFQQMTQEQCQFAYRDSIFKRQLAGKVVITAVQFKLALSLSLNISYPALAAQLKPQTATASDVFETVCAIRSAKLPHPRDIPNAGSFFKNPLVDAATHASLKARFSALVSYAIDSSSAPKQYKLAAAWLLDTAGWKQRELDGVRVHHQQALVIINPEHKSGAQVLAFAKAIQADIQAVFGVVLEIEPSIC